MKFNKYKQTPFIFFPLGRSGGGGGDDDGGGGGGGGGCRW